MCSSWDIPVSNKFDIPARRELYSMAPVLPHLPGNPRMRTIESQKR